MRGLGSDLAWDRNLQPDFWGTWQLTGDRIIIRRTSITTTYTIKGDVLISDRDRPWRKLPTLANIRIEGSFARKDFRDADAPRLLLHSDGSYEDRNGFLRMVGSAYNLVVPDGGAMVSRWSEGESRQFLGGGSGTYSLENFTLTLHDRDGRVWQINAFLPPGETLPNVGKMVINTYKLVRD